MPFFKTDSAREWVQQARHLYSQLPPRGMVGSRKSNAPFLPGNHPSLLRGEGREFHQLRPYQAGDPLTAIDWRATARASGQVITRETKKDGQTRTAFVCDASLSMTQNAAEKYSRAALFSLTLALSIKKSEQGLISYGARHHKQDILTMAQHLSHAAIAQAPPSLVQQLRHHAANSRLILMTDGFLQREEWQKIFQLIAAKKMRGFLLLILNEEEMTFPFEGRILFHDEDNDMLLHSASHQQEAYITSLRAHHEWLRRQAQRANLRFIRHRLDDDARALVFSLTRQLAEMT